MWFSAIAPPVRAVVLVVHGLNLRPQCMDPLCQVLLAQNFDVLRATLKGHQGPIEEMQAVTLETWMAELEIQVQDAQNRARSLGVPLFFLGFSLGGLLGCLLQSQGARFDRQILMAPGIAPRVLTRAVKFLDIFGSTFLVPSLSPAGYGAHDATSLAAYHAAFQAVEKLQASDKSRQNLPTLLIIDPKDAIVDFNHLTEFITDNQLNQWRVFTTSTHDSKVQGTYHHLIIDEASLGSQEWSRVTAEISTFLSPDSP
ncbi:alpha/beta fold hydrolase [Bdellovibrionota bacterium FG-2]